jgi:hypothetical protein
MYGSSGMFFPGDLMLIASDALARWYLGPDHEARSARKHRLRTLRSLASLPPEQRSVRFEAWLRRHQADRTIEMDDVSLLWIEGHREPSWTPLKMFAGPRREVVCQR